MNSGPMTNWQSRRAFLNHDWLKNQFIPALAKSINVLNDRVEDPDFNIRFLNDLVVQWKLKNIKLLELSVEFESAMSPRSLLGTGLLGAFDRETKDWLGHCLHAMWLHQFPVRRWAKAAIDSAGRANTACIRVEEILTALTVLEDRKLCSRLTARMVKLHEACQHLARAIQVFPSQITLA